MIDHVGVHVGVWVFACGCMCTTQVVLVLELSIGTRVQPTGLRSFDHVLAHSFHGRQ